VQDILRECANGSPSCKRTANITWQMKCPCRQWGSYSSRVCPASENGCLWALVIRSKHCTQLIETFCGTLFVRCCFLANEVSSYFYILRRHFAKEPFSLANWQGPVLRIPLFGHFSAASNMKYHASKTYECK